ncbi:MAG TPA: shikimate dehydrogenase [Syntrophaceticus sp.]|jgi:fatty aldehyde-generating acyl-ACP reductase|uniref:Shikimate/quinate 5-dehydrogenase n=1 Tax=Syntrophaceticus schinkii TaxID=499207 RepID=A0A0B7MJK4_9FIRM|nr:shikimate dehydrogenase [Syntrophaceticus schinkii]MDD2360815.1 shikimate dehydrogenase [Syntrophaceticus schinkii]CEO88146.1 Shikimate/quinate 5-dehydrogenase [Syntrophaceticus schinkii]HHY30388.1 shikimate dehydrogenase [Syntrophaceticus sp.]
MTKFAFIIHPIDLGYITQNIKLLKVLPGSLTERIVSHFPVYKASEIKGIKSPLAETEGWFIICPLTSRQMLGLPEDYVLRRIIEAGKLAEKLGAGIVGLGAMSAVVGDAGITVADNLGIAVTTGNSYTVAMALEGTRKAAECVGIDMAKAEAVVLGATGSIGSVCARMLAGEVGGLTLVSLTRSPLERLSHQILHETGTAVRLTTNTKEALRNADIVVAVTSSVDTIVEPQDLKPGAVVCDVARPRDVSVKVASERPDVLVIEGGVVEVPGDNVQFNFNFGFPPGTAYACMAETMILALEERCENYSLGRDLTVSQVREIQRLGKKHGFKLAGLRSFERALTKEDLKIFSRTLDK